MTQMPQDCDDLDIKVIGQRLRHTRQVKLLRLKDVAHTIGCSESMLSKIECGKVKPSLDMLHKMATALDTSIGALFNAPASGDLVIYPSGQRQTIKIASDDNDQAIRLERLVPYASNRALGGNIHVVMPGASNGGAIKHEGEEVGYVATGSLELTVADETYALNTGDSFFFRSDLPHSYRNCGTEIARVVWINTPPTF
jgi:transcriptional regulator with XRE-family HTH domain